MAGLDRGKNPLAKHSSYPHPLRMGQSHYTSDAKTHCRVCGDNVHLTSRGLIRPHHQPGGSWGGRCPGAGQPPRDPPKEAEPPKEPKPMAWTLDQLAERINQAFGDADYHDAEADEHRVIAGKALLEAREKFAAEWNDQPFNPEITCWQDWCEKNIKKANGEPRSYRDCQRVMALARAPDPTAAVAAEHTKARVGMRKTRARQAAVRGRLTVSRPAEPQNPTSNAAPAPQQQAEIDEVKQLTTECSELIGQWLASKPSAEDIRAVISMVKRMMGDDSLPRPNVQPEATVH